MNRKRPVPPNNEPTLFDMAKLETTTDLVTQIDVEQPYQEPNLFLGTSAFTAAGWAGTFYPKGVKQADYLTFYANTFKTVEIDSTYYGTPSVATVARWRDRTPRDFVFAAKVPQIITHEKALVACEVEFHEFIETMDVLGDKLGPLVFQFPFFDRWKFPKQRDFLQVLAPFLKKLPADHSFAIEIRNKTWLDAAFAEFLFEHKVALVLQDLASMPRPWELKFDFVTADFLYVRWLGDRKGIEERTRTWDKTIVDKRTDLMKWAELLRGAISRNLTVFAYANNHYAGHGPGTVKLFWDLFKESR